MTPAEIKKALERAAMLAEIAWDWDLGTDNQVQIENQWISTSDLKDEFTKAAESIEV